MDWVNSFYSTTGRWWGPAEANITDNDRSRVALIRVTSKNASTVLELGSGYGNTAACTAQAGYTVMAVELSDRISFAKRFGSQAMSGSLTFVQADFYDVALEGSFDVITYWNGFGIGTDADQRRLLKRMSNEWLAPNGKALIDIGNPFVRAKWAGEHERKPARPEAGYKHDVEQQISYDPVANRFIDTWWESDKPEVKFTQSLRSYSPADLQLLLQGTGLELESIYVDGVNVSLSPNDVKSQELLNDHQEYLAVLARD